MSLVHCSEPGCKSKGFKGADNLKRHHTQVHEKKYLSHDIISLGIPLNHNGFTVQEDGTIRGPSMNAPKGFEYAGMLEQPLRVNHTSYMIVLFRSEKK